MSTTASELRKMSLAGVAYHLGPANSDEEILAALATVQEPNNAT